MSITQETRRKVYIRNLPKMARMARIVLGHINENGPSIVEDIIRRMGTGNPNRVAPRVNWLMNNGLIKEIGKRKNSSGYTMTVFEITNIGRWALCEMEQ